ncbi:MAG: hypothetical protein KF868_01930 [Acidobacteria bacterium]|nr:hypothetical protein [Acidobacteriota bacterium]
MKRVVKMVLFGIFAAAAASAVLTAKRVEAFSGGPDPGLTGAPGEETCASCHSGGGPGGMLVISGVPGNYAADQEYDITVTLTQAGRLRFGFQATVIDAAGRRAGTLVVTDNARTQLVVGAIGGNQRTYIEHTLTGTAPVAAGQGSWNFRWRAPATSTGTVTFYVAGNAANGDLTNFGDTIYTINAASQPAAQPTPHPFATVSAASFLPGVPVAPNSIAAGFGQTGVMGMDVFIAPADEDLPTELGGASVFVTDSLGAERAALLFFVSGGQINYVIPAATAEGAAVVRIVRQNETVAQGMIQVAALAPGIFSANANGQGIAAAQIFRIRANGEQVFEEVAQFNPGSGQFEPIPINFGPEGDQIFLVLYGTGFRNNSGTAGATASLGGEASQVLFAGAQGGFVGLDQANLTLSRELAGRGVVNVSFTVDGEVANTVTVAFD